MSSEYPLQNHASAEVPLPRHGHAGKAAPSLMEPMDSLPRTQGIEFKPRPVKIHPRVPAF